MMDEPSLYEVTVKMTVYVTYGVEAFNQDAAIELVELDINKDTPVGWDVTDIDLIECHSDNPNDINLGAYNDD